MASVTWSPAASPQRSAVAGLTSATGTGDVARKAGLLKYMDALYGCLREPVIIVRYAPPSASTRCRSSGEQSVTCGCGAGRRGPPSASKNSLASSILPVVVAKPWGEPSGPGISCLAKTGGR